MKYFFVLTILLIFMLSEFNLTELRKKRKDYSNLLDEYDSLDQKLNDIFSPKSKKKKFESNIPDLDDIESNLNIPLGENLNNNMINIENINNMNNKNDIFEEENLMPHSPQINEENNTNINEKSKLLNDYNKSLNLDLKPNADSNLEINSNENNNNISENILNSKENNENININNNNNIDLQNLGNIKNINDIHNMKNLPNLSKLQNSIFEQNTDKLKGPIGRLQFSQSPLNPRFQQKKEVTYRSPEYVSLNYKTIKPQEPEDDEIFDNDDSDDPMFLEGKKDKTNSKTKVKVPINLKSPLVKENSNENVNNNNISTSASSSTISSTNSNSFGSSEIDFSSNQHIDASLNYQVAKIIGEDDKNERKENSIKENIRKDKSNDVIEKEINENNLKNDKVIEGKKPELRKKIEENKVNKNEEKIKNVNNTSNNNNNNNKNNEKIRKNLKMNKGDLKSFEDSLIKLNLKSLGKLNLTQLLGGNKHLELKFDITLDDEVKEKEKEKSKFTENKANIITNIKNDTKPLDINKKINIDNKKTSIPKIAKKIDNNKGNKNNKNEVHFISPRIQENLHSNKTNINKIPESHLEKKIKKFINKKIIGENKYLNLTNLSDKNKNITNKEINKIVKDFHKTVSKKIEKIEKKESKINRISNNNNKNKISNKIISEKDKKSYWLLYKNIDNLTEKITEIFKRLLLDMIKDPMGFINDKELFEKKFEGFKNSIKENMKLGNNNNNNKNIEKSIYKPVPIISNSNNKKNLNKNVNKKIEIISNKNIPKIHSISTIHNISNKKEVNFIQKNNVKKLNMKLKEKTNTREKAAVKAKEKTEAKNKNNNKVKAKAKVNSKAKTNENENTLNSNKYKIKSLSSSGKNLITKAKSALKTNAKVGPTTAGSYGKDMLNHLNIKLDEKDNNKESKPLRNLNQNSNKNNNNKNITNTLNKKPTIVSNVNTSKSILKNNSTKINNNNKKLEKDIILKLHNIHDINNLHDIHNIHKNKNITEFDKQKIKHVINLNKNNNISNNKNITIIANGIKDNNKIKKQNENLKKIIKETKEKIINKTLNKIPAKAIKEKENIIKKIPVSNLHIPKIPTSNNINDKNDVLMQMEKKLLAQIPKISLKENKLIKKEKIEKIENKSNLKTIEKKIKIEKDENNKEKTKEIKKLDEKEKLKKNILVDKKINKTTEKKEDKKEVKKEDIEPEEGSMMAELLKQFSHKK